MNKFSKSINSPNEGIDNYLIMILILISNTLSLITIIFVMLLYYKYKKNIKDPNF